MYDIITKFERPDAQLLRDYQEMHAATLHEVMDKTGALTRDFRPVWPGSFVCGSALTVCSRADDNLMLHKAVSIAQPGDVLVVTVGGYTEAGGWGEIITAAAMQKGIIGIVTDGSVRDTMQIKEYGFPMFSRGISMKGTTKITPGKINVPIILGNVLINPGDIVLGDNDGVVVVPLHKAAGILAAAREKEAKEAEIIRRVRGGESTMDILGLNSAMEKLGLSEQK